MLPYRLWRWRYEVERVSNETSMDKYLIWAVMDRESLCGDALVPKGSPQGVGDHGFAMGLMQIDCRYNKDFCSDIKQWGDAYQNILFGATLLRTNIRKLGTEPKGIAAYNCGPKKVLVSKYQYPFDLDQLTTGKNYVTDVLRRRDTFAGLDRK
jgi:soluble lytic murein transglycosylase-like protein